MSQNVMGLGPMSRPKTLRWDLPKIWAIYSMITTCPNYKFKHFVKVLKGPKNIEWIESSEQIFQVLFLYLAISKST